MSEPRTTTIPLSLVLAGLLLFAGSPPASAASPDVGGDRLETLPVEEIERGQTGYGLTVFAGQEPERFDVEVLGVLRNADPKASYVLARLSGHGLEESGVSQGMSGSPVFIDDRLVGAVAFAWPFATEAIAGITPIEAMRTIGELPSGIPPDPVPVAPDGVPVVPKAAPEETADVQPEGRAAGGLEELLGSSDLGGVLPVLAGAEAAPPALPGLPDPRAGAPGGAAALTPEKILERALGSLRPRVSGAAPGARSAVGWVTRGFGDRSRELLASALGVAAPAGGTAGGDRAPLAAGGPVAAVLVDGDLQLAATGTVTERHGDEILAFGHSFLGLGPLSVPMASSEILTVLPSRLTSFKISNLGPVVGAFEQDAQTGVRGRMGLEAPMIPYTLRVSGLREREFRMRLATLPQLVPALVAVATVGGLDAATFTGGPQGIDLDATFTLKEWGELSMRQSFDGIGAANTAAAYLVALSAFLTQNSFQRVEIEGIDIGLVQTTRPRLATLVAAHADRTVVRPGQTVRLSLEFKGYRGATFRRGAEVEIPDDLPAGELFMLVGDGASADAARLAIEPAPPVSFAQALGMLRSFHSNKELVVLQVIRDRGVAVAGRALPRLPGSVQSIWKAAASGSSTHLALAVSQTEVGELPFPARGLVRIDLEVRRREPLSEDGPTAPAEGEGMPGEQPGAGSAPDEGPPASPDAPEGDPGADDGSGATPSEPQEESR